MPEASRHGGTGLVQKETSASHELGQFILCVSASLRLSVSFVLSFFHIRATGTRTVARPSDEATKTRDSSELNVGDHPIKRPM